MSLSLASVAVEIPGWHTLVFRLPAPSVAKQAHELMAEIGSVNVSDLKPAHFDTIAGQLFACYVGVLQADGTIDQTPETKAEAEESGVLWGQGGATVWNGLFFRVAFIAGFGRGLGSRGDAARPGDPSGRAGQPDVPSSGGEALPNEAVRPVP